MLAAPSLAEMCRTTKAAPWAMDYDPLRGRKTRRIPRKKAGQSLKLAANEESPAEAGLRSDIRGTVNAGTPTNAKRKMASGLTATGPHEAVTGGSGEEQYGKHR